MSKPWFFLSLQAQNSALHSSPNWAPQTQLSSPCQFLTDIFLYKKYKSSFHTSLVPFLIVQQAHELKLVSFSPVHLSYVYVIISPATKSRGIEGKTPPPQQLPVRPFSLIYSMVLSQPDHSHHNFIMLKCLAKTKQKKTSNPMFPATIFSLPLYLQQYLGKRWV